MIAESRPLSEPGSTDSRRGWRWVLNTPTGLASILVVAVMVRLLLAPHFGFYGDLR